MQSEHTLLNFSFLLDMMWGCVGVTKSKCSLVTLVTNTSSVGKGILLPVQQLFATFCPFFKCHRSWMVLLLLPELPSKQKYP